MIRKLLTAAGCLVFLVALSVRSGILVDSTFLPRFLLLTLICLVSTIIFFRYTGLIKFSWYEWIFAGFYIWTLLSATWAMVPSEALMQAQVVLLLFSVYLISRLLLERYRKSGKVLSAMIVLLLGGAFFLGFYRIGLLDIFDPYRVYGISANNNLFSGFLLLSIPLALNLYSLERGWLRAAAALTVTASVFFIIILQSRAVYLGLTVAVILWIVFVVTDRKRYPGRNDLLTAVACLLILIAGVGLFYRSLDPVRQQYFLSKVPVWQYIRKYDASLEMELATKRAEKARLDGIAAFDFAGSYYENASLRMIFWERSWKIFTLHPLTGVGAGNWRVFAPSVTKPGNPGHTQKNYTYSQPHNEWLAFLSETGIPGLILAVTVFLWPLCNLVILLVFRKIDISGRYLRTAFFLTGFYIFCCFDFPLHRIEHIALLGFILAFLQTGAMKFWPEKTPEAGRRMTPFPVTAVLLVAGLLFSLVIGVCRLKGEFFTRKMFYHESRNPEQVLHYGRLAKNPFYVLTPNTLPLDWFIGVALYHTGNNTAALSHFDRALAVTPWEVRVINDRATSLVASGRIAEARSDLLGALRIDPWFDDARFNLAAIYFFNQRIDSARSLVEKCRESDRKREFLNEMKKN